MGYFQKTLNKASHNRPQKKHGLDSLRSPVLAALFAMKFSCPKCSKKFTPDKSATVKTYKSIFRWSKPIEQYEHACPHCGTCIEFSGQKSLLIIGLVYVVASLVLFHGTIYFPLSIIVLYPLGVLSIKLYLKPRIKTHV